MSLRRLTLSMLLLGLDGCSEEPISETGGEPLVKVERLLDSPIITPATDTSIGEKIQGPSLIRVPEWIPEPLGRYYLYFADHKGKYIRLAYADTLTGPWQVHAPGSQRLEGSHFPTRPPAAPFGRLLRLRVMMLLSGFKLPHDLKQELTTPHVASPDVHVDHTNRRIVMYFHGLEGFARQVTRVSTSADGIHFDARPEFLGKTYLRAFAHDGMTYALAMPGHLNQLRDPAIFEEDGRTYLLYAVAGESGIALAELHF